MKKINYKLLNALIVMAIITIIVYMKNIIRKIGIILFPIFLALIISYVIDLLVKNIKYKKVVSVLILIFSLLFIVGIFIIIIPIIYEQILSLTAYVFQFYTYLSNRYSLFFSKLDIKEYVSNYIVSFSNNIPYNIYKIFNNISNFFSKFFIIFVLSIYFIVYTDYIKSKINSILKKKQKATELLYLINNDLKSFVNGFFKIIIITFFEYTICYFIIGHPNFFILGVIASISNIIPYFGGLITNLLACISGFIISPNLFIRTTILSILLTIIDSYVINPSVYRKTNKLNPLVIIVSTTILGEIFGLWGVFFAIPIVIITLDLIKYRY